MKQYRRLLLLVVIFFSGAAVGSYNVELVKNSASDQESYKVSYMGTEIPHISIENLLSDDNWQTLCSFEKDNKAFNRYLLGHGAVLGTAGFIAAQLYINDVQSTHFYTRALKPLLSKLTPIHKVVMAGAIVAVSGVYPLIRWYKMLGVSTYLNGLQLNKLDNGLIAYCYRTYSHTEYYGDYSIDYYNISYPVGYMTLEEHQVQFEPVYKATKDIFKGLFAAGIYSAAAVVAPAVMGIGV